LRSLYQAILAGDMARLLTLFDHERLELHEPESLPYGGIYRGVNGFTQAMSRLGKCWSKVGFKDFAFAAAAEDGGETMIASFSMTATARSTGKTATFPVLEVVHFANAKIVMIKPFYWDTHALREVLGATG
jgi:ketosteroid isomerase-like protein